MRAHVLEARHRLVEGTMYPIVHVVATTLDGTRAALARGVPLARGAGANLGLLVPRIVSWDVQPEVTDEATAWFVAQYEQTLRQLGARADTEVLVCRSLDEIVERVVAAKSIVVVGGPAGTWLTSPEQRFVNRLARAGCPVVFIPTGANTTQRRSSVAA
jgi:hypothetical protein